MNFREMSGYTQEVISLIVAIVYEVWIIHDKKQSFSQVM